jgi:hypothetical protein
VVQLLIPIEKSLDNDILFYKGNITNYFKEMKLYESARAAISTFSQLDLSFWLFSLANSTLEAVASSETFNVQSADAGLFELPQSSDQILETTRVVFRLQTFGSIQWSTNSGSFTSFHFHSFLF